MINHENQLFGLGWKSPGLPVVSLESFFSGDDNGKTIAGNLDDHPGIPFFFESLQNIQSRPEVQEVLVEITDIEILDTGDQYMFPYSERVYIITSAGEEAVSQWVAPLTPDSVDEGWAHGEPVRAPVISEGNKVYAVWWD